MKNLLSINKRLLIGIFALLIVISAVSVNATSSPYSKQFDNENEMLISLSEYVSEFPDVDDYFSGDLSQQRDNYHLEEKEIIIPRINDDSYSPEEFSYAESSWGSGVNYIFTSYSKNDESNSVRIIAYYHLNKKAIADNLNSVRNSTRDEEIYEGDCKGYSYVAYNSYDENNEFIRCTYEMAVEDCYVIVYSPDLYDETFISEFEFDSTDIMLKVYVQNDIEDENELLGDANEDGILNIKDATAIQKHIANIITLSNRGIKLADFNENGDINIKDVTAIQKFIVGIDV